MDLLRRNKIQLVGRIRQLAVFALRLCVYKLGASSGQLLNPLLLHDGPYFGSPPRGKVPLLQQDLEVAFKLEELFILLPSNLQLEAIFRRRFTCLFARDCLSNELL